METNRARTCIDIVNQAIRNNADKYEKDPGFKYLYPYLKGTKSSLVIDHDLINDLEEIGAANKETKEDTASINSKIDVAILTFSVDGLGLLTSAGYKELVSVLGCWKRVIELSKEDCLKPLLSILNLNNFYFMTNYSQSEEKSLSGSIAAVFIGIHRFLAAVKYGHDNKLSTITNIQFVEDSINDDLPSTLVSVDESLKKKRT